MNEWKYQISELDDWKGIESIHFENDLAALMENAESSHVFFCPELAKAWLATYRPLRKLSPLFVAATNSAGNEACLLLVKWSRNWKNAWVRSVVPVGYSDYDYHDAIFRKTPTESELASFWHGLIALLKTQEYDEVILPGVTTCIGNDWMRGEMCPYMNLTDLNSRDDLLKQMKTSLRGDIRRQIRRLEELGTVRLCEYHSMSEAMATFDKFLAEHSARWPHAYKAPHFHENLLKFGLPSGIVHFSSLNVDNTPVAWHLGFDYRGRYYYYMPAGNREYSKFSPVKVHLFYLMSRAIENGNTVFDHLRGDENYKSGWADDAQYVHTFRMDSSAISSRLKLSANRLKSRILNH